MKGDDRGSVLLAAVIVVFIVMVVVTSMLSLASGNMIATSSYRDTAGTSAVAEGAIQTAANTIRRSLFNNGPGQLCFPGAADNALHLDDLAVQGSQHYSATVKCEPSGGPPSKVLIQDNPPPGKSNRLANAILTRGNLASQGEDGVSIRGPAGNPLRIHGRIYSNSTVNLVSGSLLDDEGVYARGTCTRAGSITPAPICHLTGGTPSGADPNYPQPTGAVPAYQGSVQVAGSGTPLALSPLSYPGSCRNKVITFNPGYYDSAASLSKMMSGSGCTGSTFWFKRGLYYFDFHDGDDPALPAASHAWSVNTGALIGGVDKGGNPATRPPLNPTVPGACLSPLRDPGATGVQFVFGGDSRLVVGAAKVELCGTYSAASPPIVVYGLKTGTEPQLAPTGLRMTPNTGSGGFTNPNNMQAADGRSATWNKTFTGTQTRSETVSGFLPTTNVPVAGTHLDGATLTVVHGNSASARADDRTVTLLLPDGTSIDLPLRDRNDGAMHTDVIDIPLDDLADFADYVHSTGLPQPLSITYSATVGHPGVESVDAITLDLKYRLPAYRSQDFDVAGGNCLKSPYTGSGGSGCAGITSTATAKFNIQGAVYAPKAALDISVNQPASPVFTFGVVARSLRLQVTGSAAFDQPVVHSPDVVAVSNVAANAILSAYVCPTTSGCDPSGGTPALRARVALVDPDLVNQVVPGAVIPVAGRRELTVQSWSNPSRSGG